MSERDVTTRWRELFKGQIITPDLLKQADALLVRLSTESPLRVRLAKELAEIRLLRNCTESPPKLRRKR
jgi:hypothetical protein